MNITVEFKFSRGVSLRFLSHLDQQRVFQRALRRADMPMAYSQGFNPHPILTFALAMPVGMTSLEEYGRVGLTTPINPKEFVRKLNQELPPGLHIEDAIIREGKTPSLTASIMDCLYRLRGLLKIEIGAENLAEILGKILKRESLVIPKRNKKGKMVEKEVRPFIQNIELIGVWDHSYELDMRLVYLSQESIKPELVLETLNNAWDYELFETGLPLKIQRREMNLKKFKKMS